MNKVVRRIHLYLGLFLLPWVFLYGITAILFNHGSWFTEREYRVLESSEDLLLPEAESIAKLAVQQLPRTEIKYLPGTAKWVGSVSFQGKKEEHAARIYLHPRGLGGILRTSPQSPPSPDWIEPLEQWTPFTEEEKKSFEASALSLVKQADGSIESVNFKRYPTLKFQIVNNGETHTIDLDIGKSVASETGSYTTPLRSRLLRLHTLHGNPGHFGARWIWIRIVDVMGIAMILWGVTGSLMWWTVKPVRKTGTLVIAFGLGLMLVLATIIWAAFGLN